MNRNVGRYLSLYYNSFVFMHDIYFIGRNGTAFWRQDFSQSVVRITERRRTSIKKRKGVTG